MPKFTTNLQTNVKTTLLLNIAERKYLINKDDNINKNEAENME